MARILRKIIELGIVILILLTPLFYGSVRLWTMTLVDLIIGFLFFCGALEMFFRRQVVLVKTPFALPILLFCGYAILSTIFFSRYEYASQLGLHQILTFAALFFIVLNHLRTQRQLIFLVFIIIANGLVHGILHLVKNGAGLFGNQVWGLSLSVGNHFAGYLLPIIPITIALSFVALSQKQRILFLIAGVVIAVALFFSLIAGAMLSFILSLICIALLFGGTEPLRKKIAILSGVIVLLLLVTFWMGIKPIWMELLTVTDWATGSPASRISMWKSGISMFADSPMTGTGLGTFNYVYPMYRLPDMPGMAVYAHSDWLQLLTEQGLIGFIFVLAGLGIFLWMVIKKIRKHSQLSVDFRTVLWQNGFVVGGAAACLACSLNAVVDFTLHIPAIALLFVVILVITTVAASSRFSMRTGLIKIPQYEFALPGYLRAILCVGAIFLWGFSSVAFAKPYLAERLYVKGTNFERLLLWNHAIEQYQKVIQYTPKNADYFQILGTAYARGAILAQNKAEWLSKAEAAYHQAIKLCPTSGDYHIALAEFYDINHQVERAEDAYVRAVALDPNNAFYHRTLGDFYLKRGKIQRTAEAYKLAIQLYPQDLTFILNRSHKLVLRLQSVQPRESGEPDPSQMSNQRISESVKIRSPQFPKESRAIGDATRNTQYVYPDAFLFIAQTVVPQNSAALMTAADFLLQKGFGEAALNRYQLALALEPHNIDVRERVSGLLFQNGMRDSALEIWREALVVEPQNIAIRERLSRALLQNGNHEEALKVWGEALVSEWAAKRGQTMAELHAYLAAIYAELERWEEAVQEYLSAARLDDSNSAYLLAAGKIHQRQGRKTDAAELWRSIIQKHPEHAEAHYQLGLVNEQEGDLSTAWEHFKAAISAAPANIDYRAHLAQSYYHSELYYQAIREWEAILHQRPDDVVTRLKLARVYRQINRQDKAHAYYTAVLKIQPDNSEALGALETNGQGEDKKGK